MILTYHKEGDYLLPNLTVPEAPKSQNSASTGCCGVNIFANTGMDITPVCN